VEHVVRGEKLVATPERTLLWPAASTLFVADLHLGKASAMRAAGVPVPTGASEETLRRLAVAVSQHGVRRLVILGDLWHARSGMTERLLGALQQLVQSVPGCEFHLVRGNHDSRCPALPDEIGISESEEISMPPFVGKHHPQADTRGYVLCGHIHPGVSLYGRGGQSLTLPCFWFGPDYAILPAFGEFTGLARTDDAQAERVFAVADHRLVDVSLSIR
jgi:DNA ligase-associated metallophosphoesterase